MSCLGKLSKISPLTIGRIPTVKALMDFIDSRECLETEQSEKLFKNMTSLILMDLTNPPRHLMDKFTS